MEFRLVTQTRFFIRKIYNIKYPKEEKFNLESQIKRASISIALNLAEGNLYKDKNTKKFFNIAKGSASEVKECLILLNELHNIQVLNLIEDCDSIIKQVQTLTSKL